MAGIPQRARQLTSRGNSVAIVTDGTAVLGIGDIGPVAALPVMEGKALLIQRVRWQRRVAELLLTGIIGWCPVYWRCRFTTNETRK